ncbi:hypothetical protein MASR2M15_08210 [Anaerolineales bacterium]
MAEQTSSSSLANRCFFAITVIITIIISVILVFLIGMIVKRHFELWDFANGLLIAGGFGIFLGITLLIGTNQDPRNATGGYYVPPTTRDNIVEVSRQIRANSQEGILLARYVFFSASVLLLLGIIIRFILMRSLAV